MQAIVQQAWSIFVFHHGPRALAGTLAFCPTLAREMTGREEEKDERQRMDWEQEFMACSRAKQWKKIEIHILSSLVLSG